MAIESSGSKARAHARHTPHLSAVNLRKTYRLGAVDVPVLKGASIRIDRGEWVAVLGASGSGKSTLLHLLGALDRPDAPDGGEIMFDGEALGAMSHRRFNLYRNREVGFVFQFYHLLPELNVLENTFLPGLVGRRRWHWYLLLAAGILPAFIEEELQYRVQSRRLRRRAEELLGSFGLSHRLTHRPRELSGGERQRVAIARALMNNPQVLLADEPTGNLDETTGAEILDLIAQQHRSGLTIVMVTHDPEIAKRADRVVRLHDGKVVES
ncbi:MAG: ABC transporter ATP-binding protein [Phycisphaerales bacterium]|nr:ABC transporter ATP-binding protein [Phycisphaerales bacterium]